jgi:hypothetical protein
MVQPFYLQAVKPPENNSKDSITTILLDGTFEPEFLSNLLLQRCPPLVKVIPNPLSKPIALKSLKSFGDISTQRKEEASGNEQVIVLSAHGFAVTCLFNYCILKCIKPQNYNEFLYIILCHD